MDYSALKKGGTKFAELDRTDGCIYLGSDEYWVLDGAFYMHVTHSNKTRYTGDTSTDYLGAINTAYDNGFYANLPCDQDWLRSAYDAIR